MWSSDGIYDQTDQGNLILTNPLAFLYESLCFVVLETGNADCKALTEEI